jgi:hypothetical protein
MVFYICTLGPFSGTECCSEHSSQKSTAVGSMLQVLAEGTKTKHSSQAPLILLTLLNKVKQIKSCCKWLKKWAGGVIHQDGLAVPSSIFHDGPDEVDTTITFVRLHGDL